MVKRKKRDGTLQDGQVGRVRVMMRDSANWRDAAGPLRVFAGDGLESGLHRPGFRVVHPDSILAAASRQAKELAYRQYDSDLSSAGRTLDCVANPEVDDATSDGLMRDEREAAYARLDRGLARAPMRADRRRVRSRRPS